MAGVPDDLRALIEAQDSHDEPDVAEVTQDGDRTAGSR